MADLVVSLLLKLRNQLGQGLGAARRDLKGLKDEAGKLAADLRKAGDEANRAARAVERLRETRRDARGRFTSGDARGDVPRARGPGGAPAGFSAGLSSRALLYGAPVAALGAAAKASVAEAISFEKAWADVLKKVNDAPSAAAMNQLQLAVRKTAIDLGLPRAEVAALTAEAAASGTAFNDLQRFVRLAAKAAVGWDMTPPEAAQRLAEIRSSTNMTIGQLETLADKINGLGDNSAAKERDIVEMFGRSAAAAREAGVDYNTTLAMLTAVRSGGMQPEVVSRWFNAFTSGLRTIDEGGKKATEGLKLLGLDAKKVAQGMRDAPLKTILDMFERLQSSPDGVRAAIKLFGKEWWDETQRAKGGIAEIRKQVGFISNPKNYAGSLDKTLDIKLATTASHLERMKTLTGEIGDRLGRWALPPINNTIDAAIKKFDELERRATWWDRWRARAEARGTLPEPPSEKPKVQSDSLLQRYLWGRTPSTDPAKARSANLAQRALDAEKDAAVKDQEAEIFERQARNAKGADRKRLEGQAKAARDEAAELRRNRRLDLEGAGRAGARDTTDVEPGEDLARATVEGLRQRRQDLERRLAEQQREVEHLKRLIGEKEKAIKDAPGQVVQDAETGRFARKDVAIEQLEKLKARLQELQGAAETTANELRDKFNIDLAGAGQTMMNSLASGITAGSANAVAQATAAAARMRAAFANIGPTAPAIPASVARPAAPASPTPAPAGARPGGTTVVNVGGIKVDGAQDPERTSRIVAARLHRAIEDAKTNALHDGVV